MISVNGSKISELHSTNTVIAIFVSNISSLMNLKRDCDFAIKVLTNKVKPMIGFMTSHAMQLVDI